MIQVSRVLIALVSCPLGLFNQACIELLL